MKPYKLITIFVVILLIFSSSCKKDFLDQYPLTKISKEDFYQKPVDAEGGLISVYDQLSSTALFGCYIQEIPDALSDDCPVSSQDAENMELDDYSYDATNGRISNYWSGCYRAINRANTVLDGISGMEADDFDGNRKQEIEAEARFVRALSYFYLVRLFGEVPLVKSLNQSAEESEVFLEKSSVNEIYDYIITELEDCANILPEQFSTNDETRARATKGGARTLLAKVHLTLKNWTEAANYADLVIQSPIYVLLSDYDNLFDPAFENTTEAILEIQYASPDEGSAMAWLTTPQEIDGQTWTKYYLASDDLIQAFDNEGDAIRKNSTIYMSVNGPHRWKTRDYGTGHGSSPQNIIAFRLADMYLVRAEALNELGYAANGESFNLLNAIRTRVSLPSYTSVDLPDQASFRQAVWKERRLELALEGFRWFDLLRTGRAITTMQALGYTLPDYKLLFPIPQVELDVNPNLTQNPGWE